MDLFVISTVPCTLFVLHKQDLDFFMEDEHLNGLKLQVGVCMRNLPTDLTAQREGYVHKGLT